MRPMVPQRTLKSLTRAVGVGVHSGQKVELTLRPAPVDSGIVFRRTDLAVPVEIPVTPLSVTDTRMATTISRPDEPGGRQRPFDDRADVRIRRLDAASGWRDSAVQRRGSARRGRTGTDA